MDNDKARVGRYFRQDSESAFNAEGKDGRQKGSIKEVKVPEGSKTEVEETRKTIRSSNAL